jgi:hypothetical protein
MAKDRGDWLWRNDRTGKRTEVVLGYCLDSIEKMAKATVGSLVGEMVATTLYC